MQLPDGSVGKIEMRLTLGIAVLVLVSTSAIAQQSGPTTSMATTSPKGGDLQRSSKVAPLQKQEGDMLNLQNKLSERQQAIELAKKLSEKQQQGCEICKNVGK